ncbi:MAG: HYR domain-containing protein [Bacteroidales bacterium]|nr:HYR domain-containing protein [Bacteroidales bacterium]
MLSKVYKFKFLLALLLVPFLVSADPPGWDKTETLFTHVLTIPETVTGFPLATGDYVGVFFNDGGNFVCGGSVLYTSGVANAFSAFGNDPITPAKDGFDPGESFLWRINQGGVDFWVDAVLTGPETFTVFGFSTVVSLNGPTLAVSASANPTLLCGAGGDVTLTGALISGGPVTSWDWYDNGNMVGTGEVLTLFVDETTNFRLEATDGVEVAEAFVTVTVVTVDAGDGAAYCDDITEISLSGASASDYIALSWETSGNGMFDNAFALNPIYYPSGDDLLAGSVVLTLNVTTLDCGLLSDAVEFTFQAGPSIDILPDQDYVCYGDNYDFTGMVVAANYDELQWFTTNGAGIFEPNEEVLEPIYVPSPTIDWPQLCIVIGVTASAIDPCEVSAEDYMNLCFVAPPTAFAGDPLSLCEDNAVSYTFADALVTFDPNWSQEILWETTGDGSFDFNNIQNPTYTFGAGDLAGGLIEFTLTATTPEACAPAVSNTSIFIQLEPSISIIPDAYTICEGENMYFEGLVEASNYSQIQWFTTNGGGTFDDEELLEPIYTPSPTIDYPQTCIIIGVAAVAIDPCTVSDEDFMDLCFQMLPVVVAGEDATVCSHELYTTNPTVENSNGPYMWTVAPADAGVFADPTALVTTFNPSAAYEGQFVVLTLTAGPIGPCAEEGSGSMNLYIEYAPYVNAGPDMTICSNESAIIEGECAHVAFTMWATTGDGYFVCPDFSCEQVEYFPGPGDLAAGCVTLVLIGYPLDPCTMFVLDKMKLCFDPAPVASAGPDQTICEGDVAQLAGTAENICGIQWVTLDGTGTFDDETILNPVYTPSFQDVISGTVHLTMIVAGCGACDYSLEPTMALTIQRTPVIELGDYSSICQDGSILLDQTVVTNYTSVEWSTLGDGTFDDATLLFATYTPGPNDILAEGVTLCLTAEPIGPCTLPVQECVEIDIQQLPTINIIPDAATICYGDDFDFTGLVEAGNYSALQWFTTNGGGIFDPNETILEPTYIPSPTIDWPQVCIVIGVVASPLDPCTLSSEDFMDLCFQIPPTVDAGDDATICEDATYTLAPVIENGGTVLWETNGDGTFDDPTLANATYTPGVDDKANGSAILTITVQGLSTCEPVDDYLTLYFQLLPIASAGGDQTVCEQLCTPPWTNGPVYLEGAVENACGSFWSTAGDGTFNDPSLLDAVYVLGDGDIAAGSVVLTLTAMPCDPCTVADTDEITVTVQYFPIADAGPDQTICEGAVAQLDGEAEYESGVFWDYALQGEGDGTFSNKLIEDPTYTPGPGDIELGYVELIMVAFAIDPCSYPDADIMTLYITKQPVVYAGEDATICEGESHELADATAEYYVTVEWTADPADFGSFDDPTIVNPVFTPFPGKTGFVTLTLEAFDGPECAGGVYTDSKSLFVNDEPKISFGFNGIEAGWNANFEYCFGTEVGVTLFAYYGGTAPYEVTYTINGGTPVTVGGLFVGDYIAAPQVYAPGVYNLVVTSITDANDCEAGAAFLALCTATITVWEEVTLECPDDVLVGNDPGLCGAEVAFEATVAGEPEPITVVYSVAGMPISSPYFFEVGTTTVDVLVENICAAITCSFTVTVEDTEGPAIDCVADQDKFTDPGECFYTVVGTEFDAVVTDNCIGSIEVSNDFNGLETLAGAAFPTGVTEVIWTAEDIAGNVATCGFTVTVTDSELPTITCPADINQTADAGLCGAYIQDLGTPVTDDNCGVEEVYNNGTGFYPVGTTIVTWTVVDVNGNEATCDQMITVTDDELPTIECPADIEVTADAGECFATNVDLGMPMVSDNCGTVTPTNNAPLEFPVGTTTVTWTVFDVNGNSATCDQLVVVTDDELPTIVCPADIMQTADAGECFATVDLGTPVTDDNCGVASVTNDAPATFPVGVTTVTWMVVDVNGNEATCEQVVTVTDDELPTIVCPADIAQTADAGVCYAIITDLGLPVVDDNCGVEEYYNDAPLNNEYPVGSTIVTWTVIDIHGNEATCEQEVVVTDDELPTIECPADVEVTADAGECFATNVDLGMPMVSDNCGTVTPTNNAPLEFPVGTTTVTWTVFDVNGNSATCDQLVVVTDDELPTIVCPADIMQTADAGECFATVDLGTPDTDDNCGVASVTNDAPATFPVGVTTVTWMVVDVNGNEATCEQVVTVTDDELPTIICPADIEVSNDLTYCGAYIQDLGTPVYDDNCGIEEVYNNGSGFYPVGTTTVIWTVIDIHGNEATCEQLVTVNDDEAPVITLLGDDNIELCEGDIYVDAGATAYDNCDGDITALIVTVNPVNTAVAGVYTVTYNVSDLAGNAAVEVTRTVTVYAAPIANAGGNATICETDNYVTTTASVQFATDVLWETSGDGFFEDDALLVTTYYPGPEDLEAGVVTLCLTATFPNGPCGNVSDTDCMILTFDPIPEAYAGMDDLICEGDEFDLDLATAANYSSLMWTGGDGTFDPSADVLNPTYVPGPTDLANGGVQLCLTAYAAGACTEPAVSCLYLTVVPNPTIDLAPEAELSCENYDFVNSEWLPIEVCAIVENADYVQWSTNGDGSFDDPMSACTNYNLGDNDVWAQMITLTLEAYGPGSCNFVASATINIYIPTQIILIDDPTWWGVSSFVAKSATSVPDVMFPSVLYPGSDALVIQINKGGQYYWPEPTPPINQLGNWQPIGYKAKFKKETCIPIYGDVVSDFSFEVGGPQLFTYVPVLTNVVTPIADLFAGHLQDILLIYDWNEAALWTEFAADFEELVPGKAYLLVRKVGTAPYTVTFPAFDPTAGPGAKAGAKSVMSFNSPWNEVINTAQTHFILFADQVLDQMQPGDVLGAFNSSNQCVGVSEFASRDNLMKLLAMGNDPLSDVINGFETGEDMIFKLYRPSSGETFDVVFTYDVQFPNNDNTFEVNGVSRAVGMSMTATSIGNQPADFNVNVFPNPATDVINIVSDYSITNVSLVNYVGQTVYNESVSGNNFQINVSTYATGMYFVRIETSEGTVVTKRIAIK